MIRIRRVPARWRRRRYELELTPPDVPAPWRTPRPVPVRGVSKALEQWTGPWHPADFWPLIHAADALFAQGSDDWGCDGLPPDPLTSGQRARLIALVARRAPDLLPVAEAVNDRWLTDSEVEALSDVALAEFLDHLGSDDEPDREGVEADDLLGALATQRRAYWEPPGRRAERSR